MHVLRIGSQKVERLEDYSRSDSCLIKSFLHQNTKYYVLNSRIENKILPLCGILFTFPSHCQQ